MSGEHRFIGDFRLVRKLGEGGMGVVYEAEQQHPRRPVALKVIRGGAHVSADTLKLFQREAQTLARLRHPSIAALYETGATEDGLHFFAMELVRGDSLTDWLKKRPRGPVSPDELRLRLGVFKRICDAVAYAHQKGVIHRDLKPGNVLIPKTSSSTSMQDSVPDVKVLDFGLARMTDTDLQMTTYNTEMGKVRGTLPYMSPEQVRGNPDEIDLRTDVYSLGVILYEMVAGKLPLDVSQAQIPEAVRIICEEPPRSLTATFSGTKRLDADVITMAGKALEKEASRRYQSAVALGDDVQHWLDGEPIHARRPSAAYQLRKLVLRHKGAFAAAAGAFVLLAAFATAMTFQAARIARERDRANQEAETARQVSEFLEGLFKVSDPSESRGNTITAREILDKGAEKIERELRGQEGTKARLMDVMGRVYMGLGLNDRARPLVRGAIEAFKKAAGDKSLAVADGLNLLGQIEVASGNALEALRLAKRAHEMRESILGSSDPRLAAGLWNLGATEFVVERFEEAEACMRRGLALVEKHPEGRERLRVWFLNDLGNVFSATGRRNEAENSFRKALSAGQESLGAHDFDVANIENNLCLLMALQGRYDEGRSYCERAIAGDRPLGPDHPVTLNHMQTLGDLERRAGRLDRAEAILRDVLARAPAGMAGMIELSLAQTLDQAGRKSEAETAYRHVLALRTGDELHGESRSGAEAMEALASFLRKSGRESEAAPLEARARDLRLRVGSGQGSGNFAVGPSAHRQ